jgi:hypothetical protein
MQRRRPAPTASNSPDMLAAALATAAAGVRVFPLHGITTQKRCACGNPTCSAAGKHPRPHNGFKSATTDAAQIMRWWSAYADAGIGAVPGTTFVVLDIDPRNGGEESLIRLEAQHAPLPITAVVLTGRYEDDRRGRHLWFRAPDGRQVGKTSIAPVLDLISTNGYVVVPPSPHVTGVRYQWLR